MVTLSSTFVHPLMTCFYGVVGGGLVSFGLMKWQMKKQAAESNIKILHDVQGPIDIGSGLTSLFPNVQLIYNDKKIDDKIQYITGTIKNTDEKRTVKTLKLPFELILPQNCEVLESKIMDAPKEEIKSEIKGNIVEISTPETFLRQEQIKYCILYKSPDKVETEINLETRIADVEIIKTENEADKLKVENKQNINSAIMIAFMFILFGISLTLLFAHLDVFGYYEPIFSIASIIFTYIIGYIIYKFTVTSVQK